MHSLDDYRRGIEAGEPAPGLGAGGDDERPAGAPGVCRGDGRCLARDGGGRGLLGRRLRPRGLGDAVIIAALRAGVKDFLRRPLSSADLGQLIDRLTRRSLLAPQRLGKVIFFLGNKGGVGKSTVAINVACGLAGPP